MAAQRFPGRVGRRFRHGEKYEFVLVRNNHSRRILVAARRVELVRRRMQWRFAFLAQTANDANAHQ